VCAIAGVCRDGRGTWAMVTLASEPDGFEETRIVDGARIAPDRLHVDAGPLQADERSLTVELGRTLHARFEQRRGWERPLGPLGVAHLVPWLGQYWAPHLLSARVSGSYDGRSLAATSVYAEKNWGAAFAAHWWWGQSEFAAFAGGRVHGVAPTAVAVWTDEELITLAPPLARTVARAGGGEWQIRARSPRWRVELSGEAADPLLLPVPLPAERRLEIRSRHHLRGRMAVVVKRGRRTWLRAESSLAALEDGATPPGGS
jgi:tocopherol cyclase